MTSGIRQLRPESRGHVRARTADPADAPAIQPNYLSAETDDAILDYARGHGASVHHAVSSCRMGRDRRAVVDDRLRVHGLGGLRVIDASVMPTMPSANTNAATLMIAEKGADLILADHRRGA